MTSKNMDASSYHKHCVILSEARNLQKIVHCKILKYIFAILILNVGCEGMKTELDVDSIAFPPKLCITAILDGASGTFSIVISEGRALADYKKPRPPQQEIKRNGEIRLYEDHRLILSEAGVFDLAKFSYNGYGPEKNGHHFDAGGIVTHPGSTYRLEVEVDGYKMVTSTSEMPALPVVSATMNTSVTVKKETVKEYNLLNWSSDGYSSNAYYWPVSLQWGERNAGRNYYALEMIHDATLIEGEPVNGNIYFKQDCGIFVSDLSKLQDNPEIEISENQDINLDVSSRNYDLYRFPILLMSDLSFTNENASLTLYKTQSFFLPQNNPPGYEKEVYQHKVTLRVQHITEATFKYYRSLALQNNGMGFFTEPVNIISNIENGYGGFMVFSAADIQLLEYQSNFPWEWF